MKSIGVLLCLSAFLAITFVQNCSAELVLVPENCQQYNECDRSGCFLKSCGAGTEFNPLIGTCDYPLGDRTDCRRSGPTIERFGR